MSRSEGKSGRIWSGADAKKLGAAASPCPASSRLDERTFQPMMPPCSESAGPPLKPARTGAS
eukprot:3847659-Prymnesium_polylepis.1